MDTQLLAIQQCAARRNSRIVGVFRDVQSGGDYVDRKDLQRALSALENDEADELIIYDMSRYSRDAEHQQLIKKRVQRAGKQLAFATMEVDLESPDGQMMFGVSGVFAEHQRLKTRELTMRGNRRRAEEGKMPRTGMRPYGFYIVSKAAIMEGRYSLEQFGTYIEERQELARVETIFELVGAGHSLYKVAAQFTEQGIPTPRGAKVWRTATIRSILTNPLYKGQPQYGKTKRVRDDSRLERGMSKSYHRPTSEAERVTITIRPVVTPELWERCQERLRSNKARLGGRPDRVYLLTGLLVCPKCGRGLGSRFGNSGRKKNGVKTVYYVCRRTYNAPSTGAADCNYKTMHNCTKTDAIILRQVIEEAKQPWRSKEYAGDAPQGGGNLKGLRKQLDELTKRQDALIEAQTRAILNGVSSEPYETKLMQLSRDLEAVAAKLRAIEGQRKTQEVKASQAERRQQEIAATVANIENVLLAPTDKVSNAQKREMLSMVVEKIVPHSATEFEIIWLLTIHNTNMHYQDNRVQYFLDAAYGLQHLNAWAQAGVVGFLFGRGDGNTTTNTDAANDGITNPPAINGNTRRATFADDDGGYFRERAAAYFLAPLRLPGAP